MNKIKVSIYRDNEYYTDAIIDNLESEKWGFAPVLVEGDRDTGVASDYDDEIYGMIINALLEGKNNDSIVSYNSEWKFQIEA